MHIAGAFLKTMNKKISLFVSTMLSDGSLIPGYMAMNSPLKSYRSQCLITSYFCVTVNITPTTKMNKPIERGYQQKAVLI